MPGFFDEAVYPRQVDASGICLLIAPVLAHCFSITFFQSPTCGSRPIVSDASCRWRLSLSRFVCTPNMLAAVLPPGTLALLPHSSTGSDRYTGMIYFRDQRTVRKLTLNPFKFFWEFF